jgi:hypothetical protein
MTIFEKPRAHEWDYALVSCDGELYSIEWYGRSYGYAINEDTITIYNESVMPREELIKYTFSSHIEASKRFKELSLNPRSYLNESIFHRNGEEDE